MSQKIDTTSIKPLRSAQWMEKALKGETNPIDVNESALYGWNLDTYTGLVGLPDQDVFIRLVDITPEQTSVHFDPLDTDFEYDKTSVMILGKNLNVLNEHFIDTPENSNYAYFTKDNTIYFLNDPESEADENRLYFNEFKVVGL